MGLERLKSIFNEIDDNVQSLEDGIPVESISNSLFDDFHSFGTQGNRSELVEIVKIDRRQSPSPLMAINGIFSEEGAPGDQGARIPTNAINGHNFGQIRINDNNGTNLIKTVNNEHGFGEVVSSETDVSPMDLGKGRYVLENLFDITHGNNTPTVQEGPNNLQKDTLLFSRDPNVSHMGGYNNLDIRSTQGYGGRGNEPIVVQPIGSTSANAKKRGYDRDFLPLAAAARDLQRLYNYYISADGLSFIGKENLTNLAVGDGFTIGEPFRAIMAPPLPVPMTGFLNNYQQKFQSNFPSFELYKNVTVKGVPQDPKTIFKTEGITDKSLRKPFRVSYSTGVSKAPPLFLSIQGDLAGVPFNIDRLGNENEQTRRELRKEMEAARQSNFDTTIMAQYESNNIISFMDSDQPPAVKQVSQPPATRLDKLKEGTKDLASFAFVKTKNAVVKQLKKQAAKLSRLPALDQPTRNFLDLRGGGTDHRDPLEGYIDYFSQNATLDPFDTVDGTKEDEVEVDKGDFYVRIRDMRAGQFLYFRGYVTGITENLTPSWNPTSYIGRSEDVWIYQKGERDLSFNLRVAPQNQIEFSAMYDKMNSLTSLIYPRYSSDVGLVRMQPPFTELYMAHIGSKAKGQFGYIKSMTYTVNEQGDWDALSSRPRVFDIAMTYQILHKKPPQIFDTFYGARVDE